jgi:hypothetical protein
VEQLFSTCTGPYHLETFFNSITMNSSSNIERAFFATLNE